MREHYDFTNARPNPYAEKMKNGYSVAIHYESMEDIENDDTIRSVIALLKKPGLNSLHLYLKKDNTSSVKN
ncbi:MAG: hypothetical protein FWE83_07470 [Oscillospiraceae bacterium]|nr:hypothetical protein [Oscillospiraceae bacterium]